MKLRQAIPPAILGAIIAFMIIGIGFIAFQEVLMGMSQEAAMGATVNDSDVALLMLSFMALVSIAFVIGGFTSAYLSTRNLKDKLTPSLLTSGLSGAFSAFGWGAVTLVMSPIDALLLPAAIAVGVGSGAIGGFMNALLLGKGESHLSKTLSKTMHSLTQRPIAYLPALVFMGLITLVGYAFEKFTAADQNLLLAVNIGVAIATLALSAFAITGVVLSAKSKKVTMAELLKESVTKSKNVFFGLIALIVPLVVIAGAMALLVLAADPSTLVMFNTPVGAGLIALMLTAISIVFMGFSFLPQTALLEKEMTAISALRKSFQFVKGDVTNAFSFYSMALGAIIAIQAIALVAPELVSTVVNISWAYPGIEFVVSIVIITFVITAQTHYYSIER